MKIRKGDRVLVLAGKDKGKEGTIVRVLPSADKVVVEGCNIAKRHQKPTRSMDQGGIIEIEMPMHVSNVAILDPDGKPTKVSYQVSKDGSKVRVSRRTGAELS